VPVPDTVIVSCFIDFLQVFVPCFTAPSFRTFAVLCSGWVLAMGQHTVTGVVRAANAVGWKHIRTFHRFFAEGRWATDEVGLVLVRLIDGLLLETITRKRGVSIALSAIVGSSERRYAFPSVREMWGSTDDG
jgi:hypothetical protein